MCFFSNSRADNSIFSSFPTRTISSSSRYNRAPNPLVLVGLTLVAFGTFAFIVNRQASLAPASKQPRHHDHPLNPPRHDASHDSTDREGVAR